MRAIVVERHGGPEALEPREVPDPPPRDGQVLVDVEAIGINYRDVYERAGRGAYAAITPAIVGVEGAGTLAGTGERVAWMSVPGRYHERRAADRERLVPIPEGVTPELAAAALLQGMTAHLLCSG